MRWRCMYGQLSRKLHNALSSLGLQSFCRQEVLVETCLPSRLKRWERRLGRINTSGSRMRWSISIDCTRRRANKLWHNNGCSMEGSSYIVDYHHMVGASSKWLSTPRAMMSQHPLGNITIMKMKWNDPFYASFFTSGLNWAKLQARS